jgi:hypothetical protein
MPTPKYYIHRYPKGSKRTGKCLPQNFTNPNTAGINTSATLQNYTLHLPESTYLHICISENGTASKEEKSRKIGFYPHQI